MVRSARGIKKAALHVCKAALFNSEVLNPDPKFDPLDQILNEAVFKSSQECSEMMWPAATSFLPFLPCRPYQA